MMTSLAMFDFRALLRREIIMKLVELVFVLVMIGLFSGRMETTNANKTQLVHATAFMCLAICLITVTTSVLDCPVDERMLVVLSPIQAVLFVVAGGLLMEGVSADSYTWSNSNWSCHPFFYSKDKDWVLLGAGIFAFATAIVLVVDMYLVYHVARSPQRASLAAKRRFNTNNPVVSTA